MKPIRHKRGGWCVQFSAKNSGTGKRVMRYYRTQEAAEKDIKKHLNEVKEFGRSSVTSEERDMIHLARQQLGGDLSILPQVLEHWRRTGAGSIEPIAVEQAVELFQGWHLPRVKDRTASDVRHRLKGFSTAFHERLMHQIHPGDIETWLHGFGNAWTARSYYKRIKPLFAHGVRHRWLIDDPIKMIKPPDVPYVPQKVYTGLQFGQLLTMATLLGHKHYEVVPGYLAPAILLQGLAWCRTSELVRLYKSEDVLMWEDVDWNKKRIHIRPTVGKATKRKTGNERFIPVTDVLLGWLKPYKKNKGYIVPVMHGDFAEKMRYLHSVCGEMPMIHNGLRRSAISHYLAAYPETGIGQLARWAETSEATIKRHYLEVLTAEDGEEWFKVRYLTEFLENVADKLDALVASKQKQSETS